MFPFLGLVMRYMEHFHNLGFQIELTAKTSIPVEESDQAQTGPEPVLLT